MTDQNKADPRSQTLLAVSWEWSEGPHKGARFWGCHATENDGRLRDWPSHGMRALGAALVTVVDGEGLDLLPPAAAPDSSKGESEPK